MAIARLRAALARRGVQVPIVQAQRRGSATMQRWRLNRSLRAARLPGYDAVIGVNGDGWMLAGEPGRPFVALVKALYAGAVQHEHGLSRAMLRVHARWEAHGARRADLVITPSAFAAERVKAQYSVDPSRVHVVAEPFDLGDWQRQLPRRHREGTRVLCVAHLYPRKRVDDLIDAWRIVHERRPDARLDIVGDGPEVRELVHRSDDLDSCYLHGHVDHPTILEFYARADSFCLPSAQETFGYAAVEAMASGLPVVVSDAGALPEVTAGAIAWQVSGGAPRLLAGALLSSLEPQARAQAATSNPRRAAAFDPITVADLLIALVTGDDPAAQRRATGRLSRNSGSRR